MQGTMPCRRNLVIGLLLVPVQFSWFWGSVEGWECAAVLVGGEEIAEVGEQAAVL